MADYLALEWDSDHLSGVVASVNGSSVRVRKCLQFRRPDDWATLTPEAAGAWLKDRLAQDGIRAEKVLVALPRSAVVVKRLEVPDVPDEELPTLVRFQAASKAAQSLDELALDFIPTPRKEGMPREVLVVTCPKEDAEHIRATCQAAGLQLASLGVTPVALAELVARIDPGTSDPQSASVVISRHGPRVEIFVLRQQVLIFSHATRLREDFSGHEQLQATVGEISRSLVSLRGQVPGLKIGQAWLLADPAETAGLATALRPRLGCEVQMLDPFTTVTLDLPAKETEPVDVSWFAGPIGMLLATGGAKVPGLDFLSPRQPPVKRDPRRAQYAKVGVAAAVLLLLGAGWYAYEYLRLSAELADLQQQDSDLTEIVARGQAALKSAEAVEKWKKSEVAWLDQLIELGNRLPPTDRIYLSDLSFEPPRTGDTGGRIIVQGVARERADVLGMTSKVLGDDSRYKLLPAQLRASKDEPYYSTHFESTIELAPPKKLTPREMAAARQKPAASPSKTGGKPPAGKAVAATPVSSSGTGTSKTAVTPTRSETNKSEAKTPETKKPEVKATSAAVSPKGGNN